MRDASPSVNVTPLIDILLVLLIIFMVITPLKPARFKAYVPQPVEDERVKVSPQTLVVSVERDLSMKLLLGKDVVAEATVGDASEVAARLASEWRERKLTGKWKTDLAARTDLAPDDRIERTVFVRAPRSVRYGEVARVIDAIKGAGAQPVGLQTDELPQ
ncbi:MAG: biopolymer transporter ExbD [Acidobacteria bacterium]|nr:biopolymer transporter ExbD [Acidobacteriota bacterium]